jgi:peptidoglycan/LPS O-acetylase OafA/YrhL
MSPRRLASLDLLRFVAVSLTLAQHYPVPAIVLHFGWMGVDLFFVLSGFLVTGLLFSEYRARGDADATRFLVRRAFKIYPPFWAMIAVTCAVLYATHARLSAKALACELLFLQNYGPALWVHTWSLAVEEHFYLAAALVFVAWRRPEIRAFVRRIGYPAAVCAVPIGILVLRCASVALIPRNYKLLGSGTHMRLDALFSGSVLAYFYHWHPKELAAFVHRFRVALWVAIPALLAPMAFVETWGYFVETIGFTNVYLAADAALLLTLYAPSLEDGAISSVGRMASVLGRYSYGTYLWHVPLEQMVLVRWTPWMFVPASVHGYLLFAAASFAVGVVLTKLIEAPSLAIRDRLFPGRASALG